MDLADTLTKGVNTFNMISKVNKTMNVVKTISYAVISAIILINVIDIMRDMK